MTAKPTLALNRAATPRDSQEKPEGAPAVVVSGVSEPVRMTFEKLLAKTFMDETDRQTDGAYRFSQGTVDARITEEGSAVKLYCKTTRPDSPVVFNALFHRAENGDLVLGQAFSNHRNPELDSQFVNNPRMLDFALSKVYEEVRLVKDPVWFLGELDHADTQGEGWAQEYIDAYLSGVDPRAALPSFEA